jgi:hypothetical protein
MGPGVAQEPGRPAGEPGQDRPQAGDRSRFKVCVHPGFVRARDKLAPDTRATADAQFREFVAMWRSGASERDLHNRWEYKQLEGDDARGVGLRQVSLRRERVLFIIVTEAERMWLLEVFTKTAPNQQRAAIKRAVGYAKEIREESDA